MLDIGLVIDAYGITHDVSGFGNPLFWQVDIFDTEACLKVLQEAQGRDITMKYPGNWIYDGGHWEYTGEKDPNFDFLKFLDRVEENQEEIEKQLDAE